MASKKSRARKYRPLPISRTKYVAGMAALISLNVLDGTLHEIVIVLLKGEPTTALERRPEGFFRGVHPDVEA